MGEARKRRRIKKNGSQGDYILFKGDKYKKSQKYAKVRTSGRKMMQLGAVRKKDEKEHLRSPCHHDDAGSLPGPGRGRRHFSP